MACYLLCASVVLGIVWGLVPLQGAVGFVSFAVLNVLIVFFYYSKFLDIDEESYGRMALLQEGFMPSVGLFVVGYATASHGFV